MAKRSTWIGQLAEAQLWRTRLVTADRDEVRQWQAALRRMSASSKRVRRFVVAQALARQGEIDAAVLAYLQVAWMQDVDRELASESLVGRGTALAAVAASRGGPARVS